jgi:methyl-accepting chemotaxis protein
MQVSCEECGKLYNIPPEKLTKINDEISSLTCKECGYVITVLMSKAKESKKKALTTSSPISPSSDKTKKDKIENTKKKKDNSEKISKSRDLKLKGLGLRDKMLFLFLVIPLTLMAGAGLFSQKQLNYLTSTITADSTKVVVELVEEKIIEKARSVALQSRIHLWSHPDLSKGEFNDNKDFKRIAVQKVGINGSTALLEKPVMNKKNDDWIVWAHTNIKIAKLKFKDILKNDDEKRYESLFKIIEKVKNKKEVHDYYDWIDKDNKIKKIFMTITLVEGTPYYIIATAYMDDFTKDIDRLKADVNKVSTNTKNINLGILIGSLIILGLSISIYGYKLTRNIQYLTDAADRISIGELDTEIEIVSKDEIGSLAEAISRMQDSLRFSLERLKSIQ